MGRRRITLVSKYDEDDDNDDDANNDGDDNGDVEVEADGDGDGKYLLTISYFLQNLGYFPINT